MLFLEVYCLFKELLSHGTDCNMANVFQVSHVLQIMMKQKQNMRNGENSTTQRAITYLLNAWNKFLKSNIALNKQVQTN